MRMKKADPGKAHAKCNVILNATGEKGHNSTQCDNVHNKTDEIVRLPSKRPCTHVCTYTRNTREEEATSSIDRADAFYDTCPTQHRISVRHATQPTLDNVRRSRKVTEGNSAD